jgi:L-2-hydroxyglutarate oxidase LhgO
VGDFVDAIVVGAGVVGLAVTRALAQARFDVIVLEAEPTAGVHASSRNSEVIHAGIYYPPGSLKARLCVEGRHRLYAYCEQHGIGHRRLGKLIVAPQPEDIPALEKLRDNAQRCGVADLELLDAEDVRRLEPALRVEAALWSPSTGVVDSHGYMRRLQADAQDHGAVVSWATALRRATATDTGFRVEAGDAVVSCRVLINAAGLGAQTVAQSIGGLAGDTIPPLHLAKGTYASLRGRHGFRHLVYPMPAATHLGVHLTLDLSGQARFGPDLQWVDTVDYAVDPSRVEAFYPAIRRYWPELEDGRLQPDYTGIRAKVQAPGAAMADFVVQGPSEHGVAGLVNLYGIESPGLTASLALADETLRRLRITPR